jgi:MFS family permease
MSTWQQVKTFPKPAKLFLTATIINGVIFNTWILFFNFFVLARGYDKEFLGMINSIPSIAGLILGIPIGMLSDRIGRRKAMLIGLSLSTLSMGLQVLINHPIALVLMAFIGGAGNSLYFISQAPFMMKVSHPENRSLMFSLNFGLSTLSGAVGNLFGGQMPGWFSSILHVPSNSAEAYQAVLLVSVFLGFFALIPVFLIGNVELEKSGTPKENQFSLLKNAMRKGLTWKLILPELLLGFGAAITIPYMNLFFVEQFEITNSVLGVLFSISSLLVGIGSIIGPRLVLHWKSKIRVVVLTQASSLIFLLVMAFSPFAWLAGIGFLLRGMLMNMAVPLYNAFCMENIPEKEQGVVNSLISNSWTAGWAIGPFISGLIQSQFGFKPLFLTTATIYGLSIITTWVFFHKSERIHSGMPQTALEGSTL